MMKIGHGYDVHRLVSGRKLVLGGVHIPWDYGLLGHSDADVLMHAICDACLGALGVGDIGTFFPSTDSKFQNCSSDFFLLAVQEMMKREQWIVGNVDSTLVAQRPLLQKHIPAMRKNIAHGLGIQPNCVNVKATTTEQLGFCGREEGIAAHSVVLLIPL